MPDPVPPAAATITDDVPFDAADPTNSEHREFFSECNTPFAIPAEVWILWSDNPDIKNHGHWLPTFDDAPGGPTFLASFSEAEAIKAAEHQFNTYGIYGRPIRVK